MARYLLLVVLAAPLVWMGFDELRREQEDAPAVVESDSLSIKQCQMALTGTKEQLAAATGGREAWARRALRFDQSVIPSRSPSWLQFHSTMDSYLQAQDDAQRFADDYRSAAEPDAYTDDRALRRALEARSLEVVLLRLRRADADAALLNSFRRGVQFYTDNYERSPGFNRRGHAVLSAWLDGNDVLSKYPIANCPTLLRKGLARMRDGDETPFGKASVDQATHVCAELTAYKPPIEVDDPLAKRMEQARETWQSTRQLMERLNDRGDELGKVRTIAELADILVRGSETRVAQDAQSAVRKLCAKHLPPNQPLDLFVLIDGQPVPRSDVSLVWDDPHRDLALGHAGPMGEICDEFWLEKLQAQGKAKGFDVRFKRPGETNFARRAPDKVAPTVKSQAARTYNEARRTLLGPRWTVDRLQRLRDQCGPQDDCPALGDLARALDAILSHPKAFFP